MITCSFRFYEGLNGYLAPQSRKRTLETALAEGATVLDALEYFGVPPSKVDLILVDGRAEPLSYTLQGGERVAVYPVFESFDISTVSKVGKEPLREIRFIVDSGLGELARRLRTLGFDSLYREGAPLEDLVSVAAAEHRIMLSRSERLGGLGVTHGLSLKGESTREQLVEVVSRLNLEKSLRPFSRCTLCNSALEPAPKESVVGDVPAEILESQEKFLRCAGCKKIYWKGSHWERMNRDIQALFGG